MTAQDAAATAATLGNATADQPDVWVPDSSLWTARSGRTDQQAVSVASSPLILAVPSRVGGAAGSERRTLRLTDLLPQLLTRPGLPDGCFQRRKRHPSSIGALIDLRSAVDSRPDANALFGTVLRAAADQPVPLTR